MRRDKTLKVCANHISESRAVGEAMTRVIVVDKLASMKEKC
jgi:hypothetical protein